MELGNGVAGRRLLSGKRALFEQLVADGVTSVFGNPGTTEQGVIDLLSDYPSIKYYLALHEGVAVGMADAYARAARRAGFVQLHIAPGLGNAMGMLYNAYIGHSPLVVYVGQSPRAGLFQEPYLSGDLVEMARPVTKWAAEITQPADVARAVRRGFKVAEEPPQGPVLLSLPLDVLDAEAEMVIEPTSPVRWRNRPPQDAVEEAAELLAGARSPAIAVGDQVYTSEAQETVIALAELLGAPIFNAFSNGVNAPAGHPLYMPRSIPVTAEPVRRALRPHDVLLVVGSSLFSSILPDAEGPLPEGTRLIHVDLDSWELGKNAGGLLMHADPRSTLLAVIEELRERADPDTLASWKARRSSLERAALANREKLRQSHRANWDAIPISPHRLMAEVAAALPPEAVVFDEAITSGASLELYLQPSQPWRRFRTRGGGIGGGMPGTLGVQVAYPDRPVVGVVSDGASMYNLTSLWTAAHHKLPVTYVLCNNHSYRILKQNLKEYRKPEDAGRPFVEMDLADPELRFDRIAEALGVAARRIERTEEIGPALREAIATPAPVLLDVVVDGTV